MSDTRTTREHGQILNQEMRLICRALLIERDGNKCQQCGKSGKLEFHHLRYREWPTIDDLVLLCHECHIDETMRGRGHKRRQGMTATQIKRAQRLEKKTEH